MSYEYYADNDYRRYLQHNECVGDDYYGAPNDFRNYVQHFGILGMKWGVRRYQNPDGSLTPAGRKRYGTAENMDNERKYVKRKIRNMAIGSATGALTGLGLTFLNPVAATPLGGMATGAATSLYLTDRLERTDNPYRNKRLTKEQIQMINKNYDRVFAKGTGFKPSKDALHIVDNSKGYKERKFNEKRARGVDLKQLRNSFKNDYHKDMWCRALDKDEYSRPFLEFATGDADYMRSKDEDAKRKYLLYEYAHYLEPRNKQFK